MSDLGSKTEKYAYPSYPWQDDESGFYFSDASIDPFITQARSMVRGLFETHLEKNSGLSPLNRHRLLIPEPRLSWQESCDLVVAAFEKFDPRMGAKAREVIDNPARWELDETSPGDAAGCCFPANCEGNQNPFAVIEYNHDGTINDAVYIAHELGHLFADDYTNEAGFADGDSKRHMAEIQAFFTQHVLYDFLSAHSNSELKQAGQSHFIGEITRNLYNLSIGIAALEAESVALAEGQETDIRNSYETTVRTWLGDNWQQYKNADLLSEHILDSRKRDGSICNLHQHSMAAIVATGLFTRAVSLGQDERGRITDTLFGKEGPKSINDVFEAAGIRTEADMQTVAKTALEHIAEPLAKWGNHPDTNTMAVDTEQAKPFRQYDIY